MSKLLEAEMEYPVTVSESAIAHFQQILQKSPESLGIRLAVKPSGCSRLAYVIEVADKWGEEDISFTFGGIYFSIDKDSLPHLKGMHVDCIQEGLNAHLKFINPNVKGECGCGESFTTE